MSTTQSLLVYACIQARNIAESKDMHNLALVYTDLIRDIKSSNAKAAH
jgi:hypothetical protein